MLTKQEGSSERAADAPQFFVPEKLTVLQHHEWDAMLEALPLEVKSLDLLKATVTTERYIDHQDALLQLHQITARREGRWD